MIKNPDKEYKCPHCSQTSSRKYNMQIHIQRKHHPYPQINNVNPSTLGNPSHSLINFENSASNLNTSIQQPLSSAFFPSPPTFTFYPNTFFNYNKVKDEDEKERRESRRRFNKTFLIMQKIVIPLSKMQNTQFNYNKKLGNLIFLDPKHMPKAHKIYKCDKCFMQTLKTFFDFQEIHPANKFMHNCSSSTQQQNPKDNNDTQIKTLKSLQETLLSVTDLRLKSYNKLIKMIVFPNNFTENPLSLKILTSLFDTMGNEEGEDYPFRWLFELLLNNERFVDLGVISYQHWARRAYDNGNDNDNDGNSHSTREDNSTKLEKEELKQFISITNGTFGLIKFRKDNKTIYTFSYIPLYNEDN